MAWRDTPVYIAAQLVGAFAGVAAAHTMFELPLFVASRHARAGSAQAFSEFVATFGLLAVIWGCARARASAVPFAVAAYIMAAYWFTASTSFANPRRHARALGDRHLRGDPAVGRAGVHRGADPRRGGRDGVVPVAPPMTTQRVLILCTHNSARSQMAEGLLRSMAGDRFDVASAGTEATRVHPLAIRAMADLGVDLNGHTSKTVDRFLGEPWDYVITVCDSANEKCPIFPGRTTRLHWSFLDPSQATGSDDERLAVFRKIRDQIAGRLREWVAGQGDR